MIFGMVAIFATALLVAGPIFSNTEHQNVFAENIKSNDSLQALLQEELSAQSAYCGSENGTTQTSCNSVALSFNLNEGNNADGQQ